MIYQEISAFSQIFLKYALDISFFLLSGYSFKDTEDSRSNLEWQGEEKKDFTYSSLPLRLLRNMEELTFSCVNFISCLQRLWLTEFYLMMRVNYIKYCLSITNVVTNNVITKVNESFTPTDQLVANCLVAILDTSHEEQLFICIRPHTCCTSNSKTYLKHLAGFIVTFYLVFSTPSK